MKDYPFSGDIYLINPIFSLIKGYGINSVIETGTWKGRTAQLLSVMVENVYTIEINKGFYNEAEYLKEYNNIHRYYGSSPDVLTFLLKRVKEPVLFFLDAHWGGELPLLGELEAIAKSNLTNPIIIIHDFYNPYVPFGYDIYDGQKVDYEYISELVSKIYKNPIIKYNKKATGEKRGIIILKEGEK
jgi:hypothetical protein